MLPFFSSALEHYISLDMNEYFIMVTCANKQCFSSREESQVVSLSKEFSSRALSNVLEEAKEFEIYCVGSTSSRKLKSIESLMAAIRKLRILRVRS